jgi:uracil-DNA glycosylase family 4
VRPENPTLGQLNSEIISCRRCPRLVEWREKVAREKVARFSSRDYWGKPVPGFGDPDARVLIVGLAPAAHGANRTGRMFTGDRSGEWLYRSLYKFGFSNQESSDSTDDGLKLTDCYITAVIRCAPPANKPLPGEIENCKPYLLDEITLLRNVRVIISLGKIPFDNTLASLTGLGIANFDRRPKFGHGAKVRVNEGLTVIASYHPSQQNTFTGKLTRPMFESVFRNARRLLG